MAARDPKEAVEFANSFIHLFTDTRGLNANLDKLRVVSVSFEPETTVIGEMTVEERHCNATNTLHGAMTCLLVDVFGSLSLTLHNRDKIPSWSLDINASCLRTADIGETLMLVSRCKKAGKTVGFTSVDIYRKADGALVATGRHDQILIKSRL